MSPPSAQSISRPAWFKKVVGLHVEMDLGKAALLELFVLRAKPLAEHEHRRDPEEFNIFLWGVASNAFSKCTFESPLASLKNRSGLRAVHLGELFDHLDRCSHFPLPNTAAARHREEALAELCELKAGYIGRLREGGVPRAVLSLFSMERSLIDWFTPSDSSPAAADQGPVSYDFAGAQLDDPPKNSGLESAENAAWFKEHNSGILTRGVPLRIRWVVSYICSSE